MFDIQLNNRIKNLLIHYELNKRQFSKRIDVTSQTVGDIVNGKTNPGKIVINQILRAFPEINEDWLISGNGEMISKEYPIRDNKLNFVSEPYSNDKCEACEKLKWRNDYLENENTILKEKNEKLLIRIGELQYQLEKHLNTG